VNFLLEGGRLEDLRGRYPDGEDGLQVTRIAAGVEASIAAGQPIDL